MAERDDQRHYEVLISQLKVFETIIFPKYFPQLLDHLGFEHSEIPKIYHEMASQKGDTHVVSNSRVSSSIVIDILVHWIGKEPNYNAYEFVKCVWYGFIEAELHYRPEFLSKKNSFEYLFYPINYLIIKMAESTGDFMYLKYFYDEFSQ